MKYIEKIFDIQTGKETIIERDMTAEEIAFQEIEIAKIAAEAEALAAEEAAKQQAFNDAVAQAVAAILAAQNSTEVTN